MSTMKPEQAAWFADTFDKLAKNVEQAVVGKPHTVRMALACLLSGGHLLLEDVPGTGKTSLAKAIANTVQGTHARIQFTPDLLPSDVTGVTVYDQRTGAFEFHPGPVFATVLLADEINRASPKTQSALLEVMEEARITVDGVTHQVEAPFMVIATQNPIEQAGTYRLPEAQLDRFLLRTSLGYPDHETTVALLAEASVRDRSSGVQPLITASAVRDMAALGQTVHADPAVLAYVSQLVTETRNAPEVRLGASMRGALSLVRTGKTWAAVHGRNYVIPDDIKELALPVLGHRVAARPRGRVRGHDRRDLAGPHPRRSAAARGSGRLTMAVTTHEGAAGPRAGGTRPACHARCTASRAAGDCGSAGGRAILAGTGSGAVVAGSVDALRLVGTGWLGAVLDHRGGAGLAGTGDHGGDRRAAGPGGGAVHLRADEREHEAGADQPAGCGRRTRRR